MPTAQCIDGISRYKQARLFAAEKVKGFPKSLVDVALLLNVGSATLSRYENENAEVPAGVVLDMEEKYQVDGLSNWHCCNKCPIGKKKYIPLQDRSFENIAINLRLKLKKANEFMDRLLEIASDGKVNEWEQGDFNEIVKACDALIEFAQELKHYANQQSFNKNQ